MNFYDETVEVLNEYGKGIKDIEFVYNDEFSITVENFIEISQTMVYDGGLGWQHIVKNLKILGKDFIMTREEYEGFEFWEYISLIPKNEIRVIKKLEDGCWNVLDELNSIKKGTI